MTKKIISSWLIIISFLCVITLNASNLFLYSYHGNPKFEELTITNTLNVLTIEIGKTYTLTNSLSIDTSTNSEYVEYILPDKSLIYQKENTQVYFNNTEMVLNNTNTLPSTINLKDSMFNISLYGEIYYLTDSTNQMVISTPLANILINTNACLFVKSDQKQVHVYIISGNATVFETKNKQRKIINEDDYMIISQKPKLSAHAGMSISQGNIISVQVVDQNDIKSFKTLEDTLRRELNQVIFILYKTNIFGVKYK